MTSPVIVSVHWLLQFMMTCAHSLVLDIPSLTAETSKEELLALLREMYTIRRMEITNDTEYKVQSIHNMIFSVLSPHVIRLEIFVDSVIYMTARRLWLQVSMQH